MDDMLKLAELAEQLDRERNTIAEIESTLRGAQAREKALAETAIPELMDRLEIDHFRTRSGLEIEIVDQVFASISEANREAALAWLEENGHGGMIKRNVVVAFSKGEEVRAGAMAQALADEGFAVKQDRSVNAATLKAWARRRVEEGEEIPESITTHTASVAKIKNK
jgi:hypothetical protein